ncbi:GDSL esterase/lipase At5g45950 [Quercus lobata]|uniref:GDSL esterase/lipase n=1 Tax=Quercus lobata TaxID=97700 RepID=A0A7N2R4W4_QUELO|nr:GDSL esterase/lipase At5g45950 [Quercus lobata]
MRRSSVRTNTLFSADSGYLIFTKGWSVSMRMTLGMLLALALMPMLSRALHVGQVRLLAAQHNVTSILVFGDSSVDPGNNNILPTTVKSNYPPYGKDFFDGRPTGRFSNGRLATDFIAEAIGYTKIVPAFLDPNLKPKDMLHGVSFASAASGYDDLTANLSNVFSVSNQLEYFMHYLIHMRNFVGEKKATDIIRYAVFVLSMGTNDFLQNYYLQPIRSKQFKVEKYQDYLVSCMSRDIELMHRLGATRLVVVGVPPLGCMPLVKTLMEKTGCVESYNKVAFSFNSKIQTKLSTLKAKLRMKIAFVDAYSIIDNAVNNPTLYDIDETSKGCCGTGTVEYGDSCKGLSTCTDPTKYVFWDAVHPTQKMYKIIANEALKSLSAELLS